MSDITRIPSRGLKKNIVINLSSGTATNPSLRIGDNNSSSYDSVIPTGLYSPSPNQIAVTLNGIPSAVFKPEKVVFTSTYENPNNILSPNEELALTSFGDVGFHKNLYVRGKIYADSLTLSTGGFNNYPLVSYEGVNALKASTSTPQTGQVVYLTFGSTPGDGRGGFYVWDPNSTENEDSNFNIIKINSITTGRYKWVSNSRFNPFIIYVSPDHQNTDDRLSNSGNDPDRPFSCLERACAEIARRFIDSSYNLSGNEKFTVFVESGKTIIKNDPGADNISSVPNATGYTSTQVKNSIHLLNTPATVTHPSTHGGKYIGGVIIPRGTSIIGRDLRKSEIRPSYVPNPLGSARSAIFRITGGCFFSNFTFRDSYSSSHSHHKLTCFEFASKNQLDLYYQKVAKYFNITNTNPTPPDDDFSNKYEYNIVTGNQGFDFNNVNTSSGNVYLSSDNTVDSGSPYIFSCSLRSVWGMCGIYGDGSLVGGIKSFLAAQFTIVSLQKDSRAFTETDPTEGEVFDKRFKGTYLSEYGSAGINGDWRHFGYKVSENAYSQLVSCFCIGPAVNYWAESGGEFSITNSTSNFGDISLFADGYRTDKPFIQDTLYQLVGVIPPKKIDTSKISDIPIGMIKSVELTPATGVKTGINITLNDKSDLMFFYENAYSLRRVSSDLTQRRVYFTVPVTKYIGERDTDTYIDTENRLFGFRFSNLDGTGISYSASEQIKFYMDLVFSSSYTTSINGVDTLDLDKLPDSPVLSFSVPRRVSDNKVIYDIFVQNPTNDAINDFISIISNSFLYCKRYVDNRSREEKLFKFRLAYPSTVSYNGRTFIKKPPTENYILAIRRNYNIGSTYVCGDSGSSPQPNQVFSVEEILNEGSFSGVYITATGTQLQDIIGFPSSPNPPLVISDSGLCDRYVDVIFTSAYLSGYNQLPFESKENFLDSVPTIFLNSENPSTINELLSYNPKTGEIFSSNNRITAEHIMNLCKAANSSLNWTTCPVGGNDGFLFNSTNRSYVDNYTSPYIENTLVPHRSFNITNGLPTAYKRPSIIRCSGQTWEYMGNYNYDTSLPQGQYDYPGINANFTGNSERDRLVKRISKWKTEVRGAKIFATGMDDSGRMLVGDSVLDMKNNKSYDIKILSRRIGDPLSDTKAYNKLSVSELLLFTGSSYMSLASSGFNRFSVHKNSFAATTDRYGLVLLAKTNELFLTQDNVNDVITRGYLDANSLVVLNGNTTFFVRPDGSDSNDGLLNTPSRAFATPTGAMNAISKRYAAPQWVTITIKIADGTYPRLSVRPIIGGCTIIIEGNTSNRDAVVFNSIRNSVHSITNIVRLRFVRFTSTISDHEQMLFDCQISTVLFYNCAFVGASGNILLYIANRARAGIDSCLFSFVNTTMAITARWNSFLTIANYSNHTIVPGSSCSRGFIHAAQGSNVYGGLDISFSGSFTGPRFAIYGNSTINSFGSFPNNIPGSLAGVFDTGSVLIPEWQITG